LFSRTATFEAPIPYFNTTNVTLPAQMRSTKLWEWNTPEAVAWDIDDKLFGFLALHLRTHANEVSTARKFQRGYEKWLQVELAVALESAVSVRGPQGQELYVWSNGKVEMEKAIWTEAGFADVFVYGYRPPVPKEWPNSAIELKVQIEGKNQAFKSEVISDYEKRAQRDPQLQGAYASSTMIYGFGITDDPYDVEYLMGLIKKTGCAILERCKAWGINIISHDSTGPNRQNIYAIVWSSKPGTYSL
jgi:hypothetical protein